MLYGELDFEVGFWAYLSPSILPWPLSKALKALRMTSSSSAPVIRITFVNHPHFLKISTKRSSIHLKKSLSLFFKFCNVSSPRHNYLNRITFVRILSSFFSTNSFKIELMRGSLFKRIEICYTRQENILIFYRKNKPAF